MSNTITDTNFNFPGQIGLYKGKVREVYTLENDVLVMVATDRLSAFDVVMPKGIPYKGQILNQIATKMMRDTEDLVPNWLTATPDPNVAVGKACEPFKVEMVIRGYISGHAAREYKAGRRSHWYSAKRSLPRFVFSSCMTTHVCTDHHFHFKWFTGFSHSHIRIGGCR